MFKQEPIFASRLAVIRDKRGRDNEGQLYIFILTEIVVNKSISRYFSPQEHMLLVTTTTFFIWDRKIKKKKKNNNNKNNEKTKTYKRGLTTRAYG